jgi:hypothetical protein
MRRDAAGVLGSEVDALREAVAGEGFRFDMLGLQYIARIARNLSDGRASSESSDLRENF